MAESNKPIIGAPITAETVGLLEAIISDDEIAREHRGNFGPTITPREVVNEGVRKTAFGYHCGHTQFSILRDHGLVTKPRGMRQDPDLTRKGKKYARALDRLSRLSSPVKAETLGASAAFWANVETVKAEAQSGSVDWSVVGPELVEAANAVIAVEDAARAKLKDVGFPIKLTPEVDILRDIIARTGAGR